MARETETERGHRRDENRRRAIGLVHPSAMRLDQDREDGERVSIQSKRGHSMGHGQKYYSKQSGDSVDAVGPIQSERLK